MCERRNRARPPACPNFVDAQHDRSGNVPGFGVEDRNKKRVSLVLFSRAKEECSSSNFVVYWHPQRLPKSSDEEGGEEGMEKNGSKHTRSGEN